MYDALFEPIMLGKLRVPNRIAMAPMTRNTGTDGIATEEVVGYYRRRAEGGCGLILTEGIAVSPQGSPSFQIPEMGTPEQIAVWRRVTEAVHAAGGTIMAQLWHTGMMRGTQGDVHAHIESVGPSGFFPGPDDGQPHNVGRTMDDADIARTIADCARFAATAKDAGFDGVEIHGAHGYLFDEFFWHRTNQRSDRYNGDAGARTRFTTDCIAAMRAATDPDFPIGLRFSQWKLTRYDNKSWTTPQELEAFLTPLADAGIAFFDCSARRYWEPEYEGSDLTLAGWTKKITGVPTIAVGSIGLDGPMMTEFENFGMLARPTANLDKLNDMIARGEIDMIAVGRAMLSNPDWANRIRRGDTDALKPYSVEALATLD